MIRVKLLFERSRRAPGPVRERTEEIVRQDGARIVRGYVAVLLIVAVAAPVAWAGQAGEVRKQAFRLLNQGVAAYKRGEFDLAVERLSQSASMALNSFRAHYYLGLSLIGARRYDEALDFLAIALDLDPGHMSSHVATGDALLKLGDLTEAGASYYRALKLRPEYPPALDGLARVYEAQANEFEAIAHYGRAIASDRGFAPAYTHLGDLYLRKDQFKEAVELLEEAVSVRPDFADGHNRLAVAYGRLGLTTLAVATIQRAIELEPYEALHPSTLGWLQLGEGSLESAEEWLVAALQLAPDLAEAHAGLAEVARRGGNYDLALGQIDIALANARLDAAMARRLEIYRERVAREQRDVAELEEKLAGGGGAPDDHGRLAEIYAGRGMWRQAVELQFNAPPSASSGERLAYMLFQSGRYREAHEVYARLAAEARSEPHDDDEQRQQMAKLELNDGVSVAMLGDDAGACEAYQRALETRPDSRLARLYLGNALLRMGEIDRAVSAYETFLGLGDRGEAAERVRRILEQIAPAGADEQPRIGPPPDAAPVEENG